MGTNWTWTEERVNLLHEHYPHDTWEELLKLFPFATKDGIITEAHKLKISRDRYNKCHRSEEEVQFILNHIASMSVDEIAKTLNRNVAFVYHVLRDHNMELPGHQGGHIKPEDEVLFKELYPKYTNKYLSKKYFPYLTPHQMRTQAKKFGLVKTQEKGVKWYDKEDLLDKLEHVIREMGRVPMLQEFQEHGLPSEVTFRRYFGSVTEACALIGVERPNYMKPIVSKTGVYYDDRGNACLSMTEKDISNFLISLGLNFVKEPLYKDIIPAEECGEKRFDWKIGDKYIEYFGLINYKEYNHKMEVKRALITKYEINCLFLYPKDMYNPKIWQNKICAFLYH